MKSFFMVNRVHAPWRALEDEQPRVSEEISLRFLLFFCDLDDADGSQRFPGCQSEAMKKGL
jgi:hypothetical protein